MVDEKPTVVVALSGGVDSSVAAALLVEQGYRVIGMMLRLWCQPGLEQSNQCCTPDAMNQARRVSAILGIPFYVIDAQEQFRQDIVVPFIKDYQAGETPNPCFSCNRMIRWGFLLSYARAAGADYLASGHYARIDHGSNGRMHLRKGVDAGKDQSYVLSGLDQEQLACSLFPVGEFQKTDIRNRARQLNFPVAERPDSQDLCFLAGQDYRDFLSHYAPDVTKPGPIINKSGDVIGEHAGLAFYTIGQRKGIGGGSRVPLYVLNKDLKNNALIIGTADNLGAKNLMTGLINWVSSPPLEVPFRAEVKVRYKASPVPADIVPDEDGRLAIAFDRPVRVITPGQLAVIYQDDLVIASGKINRSW